MVVEPDRDVGAVRVETIVTVLGGLWSGLFPDRQMVSIQLAGSASGWQTGL